MGRQFAFWLLMATLLVAGMSALEGVQFPAWMH